MIVHALEYPYLVEHQKISSHQWQGLELFEVSTGGDWRKLFSLWTLGAESPDFIEKCNPGFHKTGKPCRQSEKTYRWSIGSVPSSTVNSESHTRP